MLPCAVIRMTLKESIVDINPYILGKLSYGLEELKNNSINSLLSPGSRILYKTHFYPILVEKNMVHEIVLSLIGKDGTKHPFLFNMSMDANDIFLTGLFLNKRNDYESGLIEAKNAAENALLKNKELMMAQKELGQVQKSLEIQLSQERSINKELRILNKMISHDLQEPLRKIQLFASKTISEAKRKYSWEVLALNLNRIIDIAFEGHSLTKRLQQYSELEFYPLRKAHFDLRGIIESTKAKSSISTYGFYYDLEVESVYGDENKINLLFTELFELVNRISSPDHAQTLRITSRVFESNENVLNTFHRKKLRICIITHSQVSDRDTVKRNNSESSDRRGVGLDLAFCEKITTLHGGSFSRENIGPEKVSMEIVLPYVSL